MDTHVTVPWDSQENIVKTVSIAQRKYTRRLAVNFQHRSSHAFALSLLNFSVDLDDCVNHNCSNGASCMDGINSYSCNCSAGFTGLNCETGRERTNKTPLLLHKPNFQSLVKLAGFINPFLTSSRHRRLREPHMRKRCILCGWRQYLLMQMHSGIHWMELSNR